MGRLWVGSACTYATLCTLILTLKSPPRTSYQSIHRDSLRSNSGSGGVAVISDCRRVLELLVPLSAKPAMKAGLLELRAVSALAKVMHRIVQRWVRSHAGTARPVAYGTVELGRLSRPPTSLSRLGHVRSRPSSFQAARGGIRGPDRADHTSPPHLPPTRTHGRMALSIWDWETLCLFRVQIPEHSPLRAMFSPRSPPDVNQQAPGSLKAPAARATR